MKSFSLAVIKLLTLALLCWLLNLFLGWPGWGVAALFFGAIAVWLGVKLLRRLWLNVRARARLAASEAMSRPAKQARAQNLERLKARWGAAIKALRGSVLKRQGNPIYALPWIMLTGAPASGKSSIISGSQQGVIRGNPELANPEEPTQNCDWWLLNKAIVLDTAGRYLASSDQPEDQQEWDYLLDLLARSRAREGINSLVYTIDAQSLLGANPSELSHLGQTMRRRVNQLIRLFDKRFPIFIVISKCDQIPGFGQWAAMLPENALSQALGYLGELGTEEAAHVNFVDSALDAIGARLQQIRLELAIQGKEPDSAMLLLPKQVEQMRHGLQLFTAAAMGYTPYLEQPQLRGIYLASVNLNPLAATQAADLQEQPRAQQSSGLFLHDLFENILPAERWSAKPTLIVDRWRQATRNLALLTWCSVWLAALAFLLVSYHYTSVGIAAIAQSYPKNVLDAEQAPAVRLSALQDILRLIDLIHSQESNWKTSWLAFSPDLDALEDDIKTKFVDGYRSLVQDNRANNLYPSILAGAQADQNAYSQAVLTLVRDINLTQARTKGAGYQELLQMPAAPTQTMVLKDLDLPPTLGRAQAQMSAAFKAWSAPDDPIMLQTMAADRRMLQDAVNRAGDASWALNWVNDQPDLRPVTLREFWLPGTQGENQLQIPASMTRAGAKKIAAMMTEMAASMDDSTAALQQQGSFKAWYDSERLNAWRSFAWSFDQGEQLLTNEPAWRDMVGRVDTASSPYYMFLERLKEEFDDLPKSELPGWLRFAREFSLQQRATEQSLSLDKASAIVETINNLGARIIRPDSFNKAKEGASDVIGASLSGAQAFSDYSEQFDIAAASVLKGTGEAYKLSADYFLHGTDPSVAESQLQMVHDSLEAFYKTTGNTEPDDQVIWKLLHGPLRILTLYSLEQASCQVQSLWEQDVLWKTQLAVSPQEINDQLFGDNGSVWGFADGPLKPFIQRKADRFEPIVRHDLKLPLQAGFLPFLMGAVDTRINAVVREKQAEQAQGKSANILITAQPLGVNDGARAKPYAANLAIQCADQEITLDNYNMEVTNSFDWSPQQCGDVSLRVEIDNMSLIKRYPGPMGMARFVAEFQDGEHIFTPDDFPQSASRLDSLGVQTIQVRYDFVGASQLLAMAESLEYLNETTKAQSGTQKIMLQGLRVPERAGQCWTSGIPKSADSAMPLYIRQRAQELLDPPPMLPPPAPPEPVAAPEPAPAPAPAPQRSYRIGAGDTLYSLAKRFGTSVDELSRLNNIRDTDLIIEGRKIIIPPE